MLYCTIPIGASISACLRCEIIWGGTSCFLKGTSPYPEGFVDFWPLDCKQNAGLCGVVALLPGFISLL